MEGSIEGALAPSHARHGAYLVQGAAVMARGRHRGIMLLLGVATGASGVGVHVRALVGNIVV